MNTTSKCLSILPKCKSLTSLKQLHATLLTTGVFSDPFIAGKLILHTAVSVSSSVDYALRLFRNFPYPDVFMYNTLIRGLTEAKKPLKSLALYIQMKRVFGFCVDSFSFAFAVKAASYLGCLRSGIQLHCQAFVHGLNTHVFVGSSLISMYGECCCVGYARKVFDEMPERNVVVWNAVVTACVRCGEVECARRIFNLMPVRDLTSWNLMLAGYAKKGEMEVAKRLFMEMNVKDEVSWSTMIVGFVHDGMFDETFVFFRELRKERMGVNEVSLTGMLSACAQAGALEFGKMVHCFCEKSGYMWILSVNNALIDTYTKCGDVNMALLIFQQMPKDKSVVSWTSMMAGLAMYGRGEEAISLFHEMEEVGIMPDGITFISLLYACSHAGLLEQGWWYFAKMKDVYKIEPTFEHYGCMVDLYGRAGQLKKAYEFALQMPVPPNAVIWRTLLGACSIHGDLKLAELVKERLSELEPNDYSDHVLLSNVYAVSGKWNDAAAVRRSMAEQNIKKFPGWSMIEVNKVMYTFTAGSKTNPVTVEAYEKLKEMVVKLRVQGGYVPETESVLHNIEEEEKEQSVSLHSEKLALAFGMARRGGAKTIRIVKNLRICRDCHTMMKISSRVFGLEIVVRDRSRFHTFKDGTCSCRDYW